jgi:hypothetical protein
MKQLRWRNLDTQPEQLLQAKRPGTEPSLHIDVPCSLQTHEFAAPGSGVGPCQPHGAARVIAAGHQNAAEQEPLAGHRREVGQLRSALRIGRCDQQGCIDMGCDLGRQMSNGHAAQAVRNEHHALLPGIQNGFRKMFDPGLLAGKQPVVLHHPPGTGQAGRPKALPVCRLRAPPAWYHKETGSTHFARM